MTRVSAWPGRIVGLDLARAAAIIGMLAAHVGDSGLRGDDAAGWGWLWVADGRPSAVFAVLAGTTISIMSASDRVGSEHTAVRVATRAVILVAVGLVLNALGTPVAVILGNLGVMFLLVIPAIRWTPRALAVAGSGVLVGGAVAFRFVEGAWDGIPVAEAVTHYYYPAMAWTGYVLVGMAVGKLRLREPAVASALVWTGALGTAVTYGVAILVGAAAPWQTATGPWWASLTAHSTSPFEMVGNTFVALLVIGVCLWIARPTPVFLPALAFGSMSLSVYSAQIVVIAIAGDQIVWHPSNVAFAVLTLALMAAATVWRVFLGAGPLERALTLASTKAADAVAAPRGSGSGPRP
ncbi:heparan-alpha-glucosaminide N-acetyltransferase domain-containing protein [Demequina sp.]|uniref:heparan-alpha-glucosaminide N-acetyltransferase domain-containing protein n=1 Tax=Demequina sp. TaxID=2050685 RepID=UPI0025C7047A|nr:heparan-alpha-glucosaminide N-acetyltransferase domain-containing protein [Demequina sp.]